MLPVVVSSREHPGVFSPDQTAGQLEASLDEGLAEYHAKPTTFSVGHIYSPALAHTGHHLAEDALQETFVKAWRSYGSYRGEASEKTWLMRIAVNTCRDMLRGRWFRHVDRRVRMEELPQPAIDVQWPDDTLTRAILALPDGLRSAVTLRYFQGFSIEETASILKLSRRTIHYRLEKAEHLLKDHLEGWYDA